MKKVSLLASALLMINLVSFSQRKPDDPKHENHYEVTSVKSEQVSIEFVDAESQQAFVHMKLKIKNKTNDFILYKSNESIFKFPDGKELNPTYGGMFQGMKTIIDPLDNDNKVLKVSDKGYNYHVDHFTFISNGFYLVPVNGKVQEAADYQLPPSANSFKAGNFTCDLDKMKKETKETSVSFKCKYTGQDIGILDASKLAVKTKDGMEYANDNRKEKMVIMMPGDEEKITAVFHIPGKITDMQFATMFIIWKNTFSESKPKAMKIPNTELKLDPGLTEAKNR